MDIVIEGEHKGWLRITIGIIEKDFEEIVP